MTLRLRLSASQIACFRDCQRQWGWRYISKLPSPSNASAQLGTECHAQLENYLSGGDIDFTKESGEIISPGIEHLPRPGTPGMLLEEQFSFEGPSGHTYMGYKDVELVPCEGGVDVPAVIDHKTTSDLKWAKTEKDLLKDPQATIYAVDAFRKNPSAETVDLKWIYYQTRKTRKSVVTHLRVTASDILPSFEHIEAQAEEMAILFESTKNPLDLPPNTAHCSAYGGCSYQGNCNLSPFERLKPIMTQGTNSLLAKLRANKAAQATEVSTEVSTEVAPAQVAVAVNPPEWQPPAQVPADHPHGLGSLCPPVVPPAAPPAAVEETPAKRGPGRPRKGTAHAQVIAPSQEVEAAQAEALSKRDDERPAAAAVAEGVLGDTAPGRPIPKIGMLFIDCGPVAHACADAYTLILAAKLRLKAEGIVDWRFCDFGVGEGKLAQAVAHELDAQLGTIGMMRLDSHSPEGNIVLGEMVARAALVVR